MLLLNRKNQDEKVDVYDFGLILLEILVGRSLTSGNDVDALQDQVIDIFLWFYIQSAEKPCPTPFLLIIRRVNEHFLVPDS